MTYRVQLDLAVAGSFADFLHRSNVVFRSSHSTQPPSQTTKATTNRSSHSHRRSTTEKRDYSLVTTQQPQEVTLNGNDIEMNSSSALQEEIAPQTQESYSKAPIEPPSQEILLRDEDPEAAVVEGNGHSDHDEPADDSEVRLSFSNTYEEVSHEQLVAVGENEDRLNELSPDQRSRVGRVSFESIQQK